MPDEATRPVPPIPAVPDPSKHLFFVGHRTARDNSLFVNFFEDLSHDVEQLVEDGKADVGFIDRGMRTGDWEKQILDAIGTCQVFVPLLSPPFFASPYCGKEFDAFTRRRTWRRSDKALVDEKPCVLSVIWAPMQHQPPAVSRLQRFSPDPYGDHELARYYQQQGIFGLLQHEGRNGPRYRGTVWSIALEIQRLIGEYWVEPDIPPDSDSLRNVFDEGA